MLSRRLGLVSFVLAALLATTVGSVAAAGAPQPLYTLLSPLGITKAEIHDARVRGISLDALATEQAVTREALIAALTAPHYARIDAAVAARVAAGAPVNEARVAARKANILALVIARVDRPLALKTKPDPTTRGGTGATSGGTVRPTGSASTLTPCLPEQWLTDPLCHCGGPLRSACAAVMGEEHFPPGFQTPWGDRGLQQ